MTKKKIQNLNCASPISSPFAILITQWSQIAMKDIIYQEITTFLLLGTTNSLLIIILILLTISSTCQANEI